jgi:predicted CoA-binding protein
VQCVGRELDSINETEGTIDIIDLCIRPDRGLELLQSCGKPVKGVVLQPGAGSEEIRAYLTERQIPFLDGCLLVGLATYPRET